MMHSLALIHTHHSSITHPSLIHHPSSITHLTRSSLVHHSFITRSSLVHNSIITHSSLIHHSFITHTSLIHHPFITYSYHSFIIRHPINHFITQQKIHYSIDHSCIKNLCGQLGCGVSISVINHPLSIFFFPIHDQQQLRTAGRPLTMTGAMG